MEGQQVIPVFNRCSECASPSYAERSVDQCYYHWMREQISEPCIICFEPPKVIMRPPCCRQQFCKSCLLACLERKPVCPHCQQRLAYKAKKQ